MKTFLLGWLLTLSVLAQQNEKPHFITAELGGGYARYFTTLDFAGINKNGIDGIFRLIWNPEHLISIGFESGWQSLYHINRKIESDEFGRSEFNFKLTSIPAALLVTMRLFPETLPHFRVTGGSGISTLYSNGDLYDYKIKNTQISLYYIIGAGYLQRLNDDISLGGEVRFSHYSKLEDSNISIVILFAYRLITW